MHFHMVAIFFRTKNGGPLVEGRAALRVPDPKWLVDDGWLVVSTAPKNMKVSWDDNSQHMEKQQLFQTTNQKVYSCLKIIMPTDCLLVVSTLLLILNRRKNI